MTRDNFTSWKRQNLLESRSVHFCIPFAVRPVSLFPLADAKAQVERAITVT